MNNETNNASAKTPTSLIKVLSFTAEKTKELADANSIIGEKIELDGITVIPVSKLSVGFAGGGADVTDASKKKKQNPAGAGAKVSLIPMSFLVISGKDVDVISVEAPPTSKKNEILNTIIEQIKQFVAEKKVKKEAENQ